MGDALTVDRLPACVERLTADMGRFFKVLRTYFRTLGLVFWTFDHQLVLEGSTGEPKGTA